MTWTAHQLAGFESVPEIEIAVRRDDETLGSWTPIWVVCNDNDVYVRSWYRRDTGWFGLIVRTERARVRVRGAEVDVRIEDIGMGSPALRAQVDSAYREKYGYRCAASMVSEQAAATTLQLLVE